jgi:beta-lactamase class A
MTSRAGTDRFFAVGRPFLAGVAAVMVVAATPLVAAAGALYDVSYLWSRSLSGVEEYRDRVADVLGPEEAGRLQIVAKGDLFGLVYAYRGDRYDARRVARIHTRLLQSRGLEAAAAVPSGGWTETGKTPEEPDLEAAIEAYIGRLRREGRIRDDERTAWSVYDFTADEKLVSINEDEPFEAASMVKLFVAAAFFCKVEKGELIYGSKSRLQMERAIQHSSNDATNWLLRRIGGPRAAERILKRVYPGIFRDTRIVEYIPRGGQTYRNQASPHDYSRFLYALWNDDICGAREIRRLMALPGPDRIVAGVESIPVNTRVYNKTGSTARICGDVGILIVKGRDGKRYPYTVIGIIEKKRRARNYTAWIRSRGEVIRNVSGIIYDGIKSRYDFY